MRSFLLLIALPVLNGAAQMPPPVPAPCPTPSAPLPAALAAWKPGPGIAAATDAKSLAAANLTEGVRVEAMLAPNDSVRLVRQPAKAAEPTSKSGMLGFTVTRGGTYRVAIGAAAWIDMVRDAKPLASIAHDHGPPCSGVHKMVDFALTPGRYVLQIEGSRDANVPVLIIRRP